MPEQVVYSREIEIHLSRKLRLELADLQLYDYVAAQTQVVEEQIDVEILASYFQMILTAHEGKARIYFRLLVEKNLIY